MKHLLLILLSTASFAQVNKDVSEICESKLPMSSVRYYGEVAIKKSNPSGAVDGRIVNNSLKEYERNFPTDAIKKAAMQNQKVYNLERRIFKGVRILNDIIQSPVTKIPYYGVFHKKLNDGIMDAAEQSIQENHDRRLVSSLRSIRKESESKYKNLIQSNDKEAIKAALSETQFFSEEGLAETVSSERRAIIRQSNEDYINNIQTNSIKDLYDKYENQEINLAKTNQDVADLVDFSVGFANRTKEDLKNLNASQKVLASEVGKLTADFERSEAAQSFMESYLFDNMTAEDKIKALDNKFFKELSDGDRATIRKELDVERAKEKFIKDAKTFVDNASKAVGIANNLGLMNSEFGRSVTQVVQTGTVLVSSLDSFSKGDVLGGVLTLTGLFGGGKDPALARHEQIMEQFERISGKLDVIKETLDEIKELQLESLEIQVETYKLVDAFYTKSEQNYQNIMSSFKMIEDEVLYSRLLLYNYVYIEHYQNGNQLIDKLGISIDENIYPSFEHIITCVKRDKSIYIEVYKNFLNKYIIDSNKKDVNPIFLLRTRSKDAEGNPLIRKIEDITKNSVEFLKDYCTAAKYDHKKIVQSLLIPSSTTSEIINKYETDEWKYDGNLDKKLYRNLDVFSATIAPKAVEEFGYVSRNLIPIYQLLDGDYNIVSDIENIDDTVNRVDIIENAYQLCEISLAQQNLLSGDILLPIFVDVINSTENEVQKLIPRVFELLKLNNLLAVNFSRYYTRYLLDKNKVNTIAYMVMHQENDNLNLPRLLDSKIPIVFEADDAGVPKIYYKQNEARLLLPTYSEIWDRDNVQMIWTVDQSDLIEEKEKIFHSIFECRVNKSKEMKTFYLQTTLPEIITTAKEEVEAEN